jgi:tRNA pseudouridine38-40 synthase
VVRVKLVVAYDGSGFHGFWPNEGVATVGGALAEAVEKVVGHTIEMSCAGRTDTGVHAWGQVVTFDVGGELDLDRLQQSVNGMLAPAIVVREAEVVAADFDARGSARSRTYRYTVLNRPVPDPFLATTTWHVTAPLDLRALRLGADPLIGEHDFSSFCRRPAPDVELTRRVLEAQWDDVGDGVFRFEITANAFCHQMVRSLVGTLVDVGRGRTRAGEVLAILRARDRQAAGQPAPPHGLCLWSVAYD